MMKMFDLP